MCCSRREEPSLKIVVQPAGAHRAPAVLLSLALLVALVPPLHAHGPVRRIPATEPPPGSPPPPPAAPALPDAFQPSASAPVPVVLALTQVASESSLVVEGAVVRTDALDDDRLRVHHLRVDRTLKGTASGPEVLVVDIRGSSQRAALLPDGTPVVALLRPAPSLSYLTKLLPDAAPYTVAGERDGVIPIASEAERTVVIDALTESLRLARSEERRVGKECRL